jgi:tRNA nucleotidyltransferase (CCA-adding enzyme)
MQHPKILKQIAKQIKSQNGKAFIVGGAVRDFVMGIEPKDFDVEVFGINADSLFKILSQHGKPNMVGMAFGIIKIVIDDEEFDFSLPRRDSKQGEGHRGFIVETDTHMTVEQAALRRDFTMNAMSFDLVNEVIIDPFGGQKDIEMKILRPTSEAFKEDPLRVLRGFQFAGRFGFTASPELIRFAKEIFDGFQHLSIERVWIEWLKWASKSKSHKHGLQLLLDTGWIAHFPELNDMRGCPQDKQWHPEGDVWQHTVEVVEAMASMTKDPKHIFSALCHDMGKVKNTWFALDSSDREIHWKSEMVGEGERRWRSPAHDIEGIAPTESFMHSIGAPKEFVSFAMDMTKFHMRHIGFNGSHSFVRRLANQVSLQDLRFIVMADHNGRPFTGEVKPVAEMEAIIEIAKELQIADAKPTPILMGRHLIEMGVKPSKQMGVILAEAFEAQLDGEFDSLEDAIAWVKDKI